MVTFSGPKGAPDVVPPRSWLYDHIETLSADRFRVFGYDRIETPVFEHTEVFERGLAEGSDIVTKEMYTFEDKGGRSLTLRPDMTAPVMRAVLERRLDKSGLPVKLYYITQVFRHERPQAGRYRQFRQAGVEAIGSESPILDAEVIELASVVLTDLGVDWSLVLNSIGHPVCRQEYLPELVAYLEAHREELCSDCQRKIDVNPLRTFDCKVERDREVMSSAPVISDFLCSDCKEHHTQVKRLLGDLGVSFREDPRLVRGLDYYTRTTFEFTAKGLGAQNAVGGGGRYDGLAELLGGPPLPSIGFSLGIDRIALVLEGSGSDVPGRTADVFVVALGHEGRDQAVRLVSELRRGGVSAELDVGERAIKGQFKVADRLGARIAVVIGEREAASGRYTLRDMRSGEQDEVDRAEAANRIAASLQADPRERPSDR